jgi:GNAT superfamily N-acetyltransferase
MTASATSRPEVRLAAVDDAEAIGELLHRFAAEFGDTTPGPETLARRARELIGRRESVFLLADADAGIAQLRFRPSVWTGRLDCYLEDLYVVPPERGRGLGRALLERAIDVARERGATHMDLATGESDVAARGLYEAFGFTNREPGGRVGVERMLFYERDL